MKKGLQVHGLLLFIMRVSLLNIVLAFAVISLARAGDAAAQVLDKKVSLNLGEVSLRSALSHIERLAEVKFLYQSKLVSSRDRVQLNVSEERLAEVLKGILEPRHIRFEAEGNQIVLTKETIETVAGMSGISASETPVIQITGRITNEENQPLPGVSILIKGTSQGSASDADGNYSLAVPDGNAVLVFSFIGYKTQEITVGTQTEINVTMMQDVRSLEEVVVTGYGEVRKRDLTGAIASISREDLTALPVNNVQQIMQGRVAGVQVIQNSHSPGGGLSVRIRGANSVLGGNEPLYVVDGFIGGIGLSSINPNDIESIEVLKDASATAIYGSRGANGVVIITTKRGTAGANAINFDAYYGVQQLAKKMDMMDARQFAQIANARVANDGGTTLPFPDLDNLPYNTDWQDALFRTAPMQNYSLSFNGGDDKTQYLISANYFDQVGIIENTDFGRGTIRANLDKTIGRFKVSNSFQASRSTEHDIPEGQDQGPVAGIISAYPTRPIMENGEFSQMDIQQYGGFSDPIDNPVAEITQRLRELKTTRVFDMLYGELEIAEGLKAKVSLGVSYANSRRDTYTRRTIPGNNVNGAASISNDETIDILNENTLSYSKTFGDHAFNAVAGFTSQRNEDRSFDAGAHDFVTDVLETGNLGSGAVIDVPSSGGTIWSQQSFLGRINYVLKDKYLVTVTGRSDGSSRVARKNRWTFFPSFALGWRLNEESFLADMNNLSNLKLRLSWGQTGNDRIPSYLSQQRITSTTLSSGEQIVVGLSPANLPSSELDWEITSQLDVGVDVGFQNERFRLTADYYQKNTTNLLAQIQLPLSVGFSNVIQNIGELKNTGFEIGVGADILDAAVRWSVDANLSANHNVVTKLKDGSDVFAANLPGGATAGSFHIIREGETLASYFGYIQEGVDDNTGELVYKDLDGNGVINNDDRTILGDFFPDFIYGFNSNLSWKGFDFNVFFQGVQGVDMIRLDRFRNANSITRGYNQLAEVSDYWTPENTDAKYPKPKSGINFRGSDEFVEDGSYLRLKNIQLGYNLPLEDLGIKWLRSARIYASGQNLLTVTKYKGFDPEINNQGNATVGGNTDLRLGMDLSSYPSAKIYTFGLNLGF